MLKSTIILQYSTFPHYETNYCDVARIHTTRCVYLLCKSRTSKWRVLWVCVRARVLMLVRTGIAINITVRLVHTHTRTQNVRENRIATMQVDIKRIAMRTISSISKNEMEWRSMLLMMLLAAQARTPRQPWRITEHIACVCVFAWGSRYAIRMYKWMVAAAVAGAWGFRRKSRREKFATSLYAPAFGTVWCWVRTCARTKKREPMNVLWHSTASIIFADGKRILACAFLYWLSVGVCASVCLRRETERERHKNTERTSVVDGAWNSQRRVGRLPTDVWLYRQRMVPGRIICFQWAMVWRIGNHG